MVRAKAVVQVTVELELTSTWSDDCTIGQVSEEASREAISIAVRPTWAKARTLGDPVVTTVITSRL